MLVMIRSAGSHLSTPQHWPAMPVTRVLVALPLLLAIQVHEGKKSIAKQQNYGIYFSLYILVCLILYLLWESPSIITRDVKPEMLIPFCRPSIRGGYRPTAFRCWFQHNWFLQMWSETPNTWRSKTWSNRGRWCGWGNVDDILMMWVLVMMILMILVMMMTVLIFTIRICCWRYWWCLTPGWWVALDCCTQLWISRKPCNCYYYYHDYYQDYSSLSSLSLQFCHNWHNLWKSHQVTDGSNQFGCGGTLVADNWVEIYKSPKILESARNFWKFYKIYYILEMLHLQHFLYQISVPRLFLVPKNSDLIGKDIEIFLGYS